MNKHELPGQQKVGNFGTAGTYIPQSHSNNFKMYRRVVRHISAADLKRSFVETRPKAYLRICLKQIHKVTLSVLFVQINYYG
jgi:hypothetical protein